MPRFSERLLADWVRCTRLEKVLVVLVAQQLVHRTVYALSGIELRIQGLLTFLFYALALLVGLKYLSRFIRLTSWRLRNRLILSYIFIGVVPIMLIFAMLGIGMYILMGQVATYLMTAEMNRRNEIVRDCAFALGWNVADHLQDSNTASSVEQFVKQLRRRLPRFQAALEVDGKPFSALGGASIGDVPQWSRPGFLGLTRSDREYALAAHVEVQQSGHRVGVFGYEPADSGLLGKLLPGLASVSFLQIDNVATQRARSEAPEEPNSDYRVRFNDTQEPGTAETLSLPPPKSWWDIEVRWGTPFAVQDWGRSRLESSQAVVKVVSRPSLIMRQLFSTLGPLAGSVKLLLYIVGGLLLLVEIASLIFGVSLTRSITRSVADLYDATLKVNVGDFSNRIPIRTKDQLSELAGSFNRMTASIERLIIESKEKERLESELEIAREVQTQLFPKSAPRLRSVELVGVCRPARMVGGDYYDFIQINSDWTLLAIGDISGKGISAALLMASIQSSLRAQVSSNQQIRAASADGGEFLSTSHLTCLLNQQLYESTSSEKFATFFCALYDAQRSRLHYTNAGHLPPLLIRKGRAQPLEVNGMVLGAFPNQTYERGCLALEAGDLVVAYTDGITEPENEFGEEFGKRRLTEVLTRNAGRPLDELVHHVTSAVEEWSSASEQTDDMTLVLLRRG